MFSGVVSQATNLQVVLPGLEGTYNEVMHVVQIILYNFICFHINHIYTLVYKLQILYTLED